MSSSAFSSTTASRPSRVVVSTSIMARSEAENAGTCEYTHAGSSRSSTCAHILHDQRFQPALGMQPPQRMISRTFGMADFAHAVHQPRESRRRCCSPSTRSSAPTPKTISGVLRNDPGSCARRARGELQAVAAERRSPPAKAPPTSASGINSRTRSDGFGKALERRDSRRSSAPAGSPMLPPSETSISLSWSSRFVQFVQLPLGGVAMEVRHALAGQRRSSAQGKNSFNPSTIIFPGLRQAAGVQPQNAEGQRGVNRCLGLLRHSLPAPRRRTVPARSSPRA